MGIRTTVYNQLVTEEEWKQVNFQNKELVEEFLDYLVSMKRSNETIKQYKNDLKIFFCWYLKNCKNKFFTEITRKEVIKFQGFLVSRCQMSSSRVRRLRSALSSLSIYIENILDEDYPNFRNIINRIEAPSQNMVREKTVLKVDECIDVCDKLMKEDPQLSALLAVASFSGLRKQELTRLKLLDFTDNKKMVANNSFYLTSKIKIKGKGDRLENKFVWTKCDKWLKNWIKYREENCVESEFLFCFEHKGKWNKLGKNQMDYYASKLCKYFNKKYYFHSSRHFFTTYLTESGIPINICQKLLSHKSSEVTQRYIDIDEADSLKGFEDFFTGKVDRVDKNNSKSLSDL